MDRSGSLGHGGHAAKIVKFRIPIALVLVHQLRKLSASAEVVVPVQIVHPSLVEVLAGLLHHDLLWVALYVI